MIMCHFTSLRRWRSVVWLLWRFSSSAAGSQTSCSGLNEMSFPGSCGRSHAPPPPSPKFDSRLTLSIPHNSLPPNPLRARLRAQFDTLSVYRGSFCEQKCPRQDRALGNLYATTHQLTELTQSTNQQHIAPWIVDLLSTCQAQS